MLIKECDGCRYLVKQIALGIGVRCSHPDRKVPDKLIPIISTIDNCKLKEYSEKKCISGLVSKK